MPIRVLGSVLLLIWLVLLALGKGGFIHLLLLNGIVILIIDLVSVMRARMVEN